MRLVFVEDGRGVEAAAAVRDATIVALTAEAYEAADASSIRCTPIGELSQPAAIGRHERQLVADVRALLETLEPEGFDNALLDQDYNVVVTAQALAARAWMIRDAIHALAPAEVLLVDEALDPWFVDAGYAGSPWTELVKRLADSAGAAVELLETSPLPHAAAAAQPRARRRARAVAARLARRLPIGQRLLFVGPPLYDWLPVARRNRTAWLGMQQTEPGHDWAVGLDGMLHESARTVTLARPVPDGDRGLGDAVQAALAAGGQRLELDGIDLLPALTPNLVTIARRSPELAEQADAIAYAALDRVGPDALCLPSITLLPQKRAARAARARGVPVLAYQHGGAYSTHEWAPHDLADWHHADVFLTYGPGIRPPANPVLPVRAAFVPVGSARLAGWGRRRSSTAPRTHGVLWVGEAASRNWVNYSLLEDTARYALERSGLERLAQGGVDVAFRPYPGQDASNGVAAWLRRSGHPNLSLAAGVELRRLLESAGVVVSDAASGTVWLEALVLRKPFVLHVDPEAARLRPEVAADLSAACSLHTTPETFLAALDEIAAGEVPPVDAAAVDRFLERYVVGRGRPLRDVARALSQPRASTDHSSRGRK